MNIADVQQNTPEWLALRATHDTASEAPAMMGVSKYQTRAALLKQKSTGLCEDIDAGKQSLFNKGHASEATARPLAEQMMGDLFPVTATLGIDGLKLLASLDGVTITDDEIWEHKLWSESLAAQVRSGTLEPHYTVQMDQQLLVSGATRCLFMTSDGTPDRMAWMWYETTDAKKAALIAAWKQFHADLATYVPAEPVDAKPTGKAPETLPALRIEVTGMVTASNLAEFKQTALSAIASVNRDLQSDQDFADAERAVRWCGDIEERLAAAKQHALSQTASIDELFRTMDDISAEARRVRLDLDKLVKSRKESIRGELVADGMAKLRKHIASLDARIGKPLMPGIHSDFCGAIKGKRSVDSIRDAVDTELARAKIAANEVADRITVNLRVLNEHPDHAFLFADTGSIVLKASEDLALLVKSRIAERQAAEARKLEAERIEREQVEARLRERLRTDEAAKLAREAEAKNTPAQDTQQVLKATAATPDATDRDAPVTTSPDGGPMGAGQPAAAGPTLGFVRPIHPAAAALRNDPPTLKLGTICERLGFTVNAEFLASVGFTATMDRRACLYRESDFKAICAAISEHVLAVGAELAQAA